MGTKLVAKYDFLPQKTFKKDAKKHQDVFYSPEWIEVADCLLSGVDMPAKYRDHQLKGNLKQFRECHVRNDLLLVYAINEEVQGIELYRLATHSEYF